MAGKYDIKEQVLVLISKECPRDHSELLDEIGCEHEELDAALKDLSDFRIIQITNMFPGSGWTRGWTKGDAWDPDLARKIRARHQQAPVIKPRRPVVFI